MRRAWLAAAAAAFVLGVVGTPLAAADESTSSGAWRGSTLVPDPRPCDNDDVCGQFQREGSALLGRRNVTISFAIDAVATSPGCELPPTPASVSSTPSPVSFTRALSFECNGTYRSLAAASADLSGGTHHLDRTFVVAAPAPDVDAPSVKAGAARSVIVSWSPLARAPKDFRGYLVVRTSPSGGTETTASLPATATSWTDVAPPPEGGAVTYQVRTRRAGANPSDPTDEVTSSGASSPPIELAAAGSGRTAPGGPGGAARDPDLATPGFRTPGVDSPSRGGGPPLAAPAVDGGFSEHLPYDRGPGAVLADARVSGPWSGAPGRGLMTPLATGLVLAGWAVHLRLLARAARPAKG